MVVLASPLIADAAPTTNFTMFVRVRISRLCAGQRLQKLLSDPPKKCRVVDKSVLVRLKIGPGHHNRHMLGSHALNFFDKLGIKTKLENRSCFRFSSNLGIDGLIRPTTQGAWRLHPVQDVSTTDPAAV